MSETKVGTTSVMTCSNCSHYDKKNKYCPVQETLIGNDFAKLHRPLFRDGLCKLWQNKSAAFDKADLASLLAKQCERNKELFDENARLTDENYNLRNELRITKKKEEDIEYEYAIEERFRGKWIITDSGFSSLDDAKEFAKTICKQFPNDEFRVVRRIANWEEVK